MTEGEWLSGADWQPMLEHLTGRIGKRKGTLYVCAGLRSIWDLLYDDTSREAVEVAERAADGAVSKDEIDRAVWAAECPTFGFDFEPEIIRQYMGDGNYFAGVKRLLEMGVYSEADIRAEGRLGDEKMVDRLSNAAHIAYHCVSGGNAGINSGGLSEHLLGHLSQMQEWPGDWLVREVFGNPFRPVAVVPDWRSETVLSIARGAYEERAFDRLPILADALEDAGCDAAELLAHLRGPTRHVLGCWALDLVLGKPAEPAPAPDTAAGRVSGTSSPPRAGRAGELVVRSAAEGA